MAPEHPSLELIVHQLREVKTLQMETKSSVGELAATVADHGAYIAVLKDREGRTQRWPAYIQTVFGGVGLILAFFAGHGYVG